MPVTTQTKSAAVQRRAGGRKPAAFQIGQCGAPGRPVARGKSWSQRIQFSKNCRALGRQDIEAFGQWFDLSARRKSQAARGNLMAIEMRERTLNRLQATAAVQPD